MSGGGPTVASRSGATACAGRFGLISPPLLICPTSPSFADSRDGEWARVPIFAQFACRAPTLSFTVFTRSTLIHSISPDAQTAAGRSAIQITTPPSPVFRTPRATQLPRWSNALLPTTDYHPPFFLPSWSNYSRRTRRRRLHASGQPRRECDLHRPPQLPDGNLQRAWCLRAR